MPEHPHHIRSEAYKYRFDLLFASLLCTIVVNIFFPEDIYDGIAQTIYLPIQLIAGITLFDIRRKGSSSAACSSSGACWTASRP